VGIPELAKEVAEVVLKVKLVGVALGAQSVDLGAEVDAARGERRGVVMSGSSEVANAPSKLALHSRLVVVVSGLAVGKLGEAGKGAGVAKGIGEGVELVRNLITKQSGMSTRHWSRAGGSSDQSANCTYSVRDVERVVLEDGVERDLLQARVQEFDGCGPVGEEWQGCKKRTTVSKVERRQAARLVASQKVARSTPGLERSLRATV
jgi:hypothetical protein